MAEATAIIEAFVNTVEIRWVEPLASLSGALAPIRMAP
ncbi:hypothetical protein GO281_03756 [Ralstonia solanacearum]|nr:hypothetical protein [Ralstonia solanacearum]NKF73005.1 hypothetical protein [Ralstonia solanacearum]